MTRWHTREDSGIKLDRQLRWWHDDEPVEHPKIIELFNTSLSVTEDGKYKLDVGKDWCFVTVEDAAFSVLLLDVQDGKLWARLSDRTIEPLALDTLTLDSEGVVFVKVKQGRAKARFSREAQFDLGERLHDEGGTVSLDDGAGRHPLPQLNGLLTG